MKWSVYYQTADFLEYSRMFMILPEYEPLVRQWCGVRDGIRVLDVGCGSGYFARLLARGPESVQVTGLDRDETFISYAREAAARESLPVDFLAGDALALPFSNASFDLVTSHTFFTCIPEAEKAMCEMKRVVRPGGVIASVTTMSFIHPAQSSGKYPEECTWYPPFRALLKKFNLAWMKIAPPTVYMAGVGTSQMPRFFADQGLEQICAYPIGRMFSWSNANIPVEQKLQWLELYRRASLERLDAFMKLPEMQASFSLDDAAQLRMLLEEKCSWLRVHPEENTVWDWYGGANLLLTGVRP